MPTGVPRRLPDVVAHGAAWSPDGQQLVFARGSDIYVAKADGTSPRNSLPFRVRRMSSAFPQMARGSASHSSRIPGSENLWQPSWSPDGRHLLATSADSKKLHEHRAHLVRDPWVIQRVPPYRAHGDTVAHQVKDVFRMTLEQAAGFGAVDCRVISAPAEGACAPKAPISAQRAAITRSTDGGT